MTEAVFLCPSTQARFEVCQEAAEQGIPVVNRWSCQFLPAYKTKHGHSSGSRESHKALDGQVRPADEAFQTIWGNELRYPGDPMAPAREVINCHCVLVPDVAGAETNITDAYHTTADPLHDVTGPIKNSHPAEMRRITEEATALGVEVIGSQSGIAYAPGLKAGQPGQLHVSPEDSYGAWRHEEQHMLDDASDGWRGFQGLFDIDRRVRMEYNAYQLEIDIAHDLHRDDIVIRLEKARDDEIAMVKGE